MIKKQIESITKSIEVISKGDLTENIEAKSFLSETNTLINSAIAIQNNLRDIVKNTKDSANELTAGVGEVDELSGRLNSSAGQINLAVEELATSSVTMTENVQDVKLEEVISIFKI